MGPSPPPATRVARDVAVQLAGRAFNLALGIVVTALVVRTLGQVQFGQWATILSVIAMAEYATSFGVEPTAVRLAAGDPGSEGRWLETLVSLRAAIALPAMLVTVGILALLSTSDKMLVTSLVLAATMLLSPLSGLRLVFQLRTRNDVPTAVQTLNSVVWGIGVVVLAAADADMVAFALVFLAVAVMTTAVQSVLSLRMLRFEFTASRGRWWELLRVGIPLGLSGLLILSYARLDQVLVFELAGADDAGLYGAAFRFVEQGALLPQAVLTTLLPLMAAAWPADPARLVRLAQVGAEVLGAAALGGLAFAVAAAEPVVVALFGEEFRDAADALVPLTGAFLFVCLGYLAGNLVIVLGLQKRFLIFATVGLVVNLGLNLALVGRYGFEAAAWVALATEAAVNVPTAVMVVRRIGVRPQGARLARATLAAALLAGGVAALREAGAPLGVLIAAAAVAYPALVLGFRGLDPGALRALVGKRL
jgi:O-antigen/teichoic acid export membrane protein